MYHNNSGDIMRKILLALICFIIPFSVFAYSEYIIPGGDTLGIEVNSKGVMVVGFYKVNGELINQDFKIGDKILKVNNEEVIGTKELVELIDQYMENGKVNVTYSRNNKEYDTDLSLSLFNGTYRTGLYVKGNVLGIGTLSYIDPDTGVYGVLGHSLNISSTNQQVEIKNGYSYEASVTSFTRSVDGNPGSKNADIDKNEVFGTIEKNSNYGVFGKIENKLNKNLMKVGSLDEVKLGRAYIYTTNTDNEIENYEIEILEINKKNIEKNLYFKIVDKKLLDMSGGIVQGMSGSPIIQNDKIIGAVTRVLVDDVDKGYGISIVTMLEEGDKMLQE